MNERTAADILAENEDLKARLEETEEVLRAIRSGEVDAIVGTTGTGGKIYTLKGAETPYRHFIETISEGAVTLGSDGTVLYGNRGFADIIHLPPEKILGLAFSDLVVDSDREMVAAMLSTAIDRPVFGELNLKVTSYKDTEPVPVQLSLSRMSGDNSETVGGIITDLTPRKQTEDIIRSEQLARSVFEQAGEAVVVCNTEGTVIRSNAVANRLAGTYPVFQPFTTVFPVIPSGNRTAKSLIQALLSGSTFRGVEVHLAGGDSAGFDLLFSGSPLKNEAGVILGSVIVLSDITALREAEAQVHEHIDRYKRLFTHLSEGSALHELIYDENNVPQDYRILEVNPAYENILGLNSADVVGKTSREAYSQEKAPFLEIYARVTETNVPETFETFFEPMGKYFSLSVYSPIKGFFVTVFSDITEKHTVMEALRESEEKFRTLIEAANDAIYLYEISHPGPGRILMVNQAASKMLGYTEEEFLELTIPDLHDPDDEISVSSMFERIRKEGKNTIEWTHRTKNGTILPVEISQTEFESGGRLLGVSITRDITDRKASEKHIQYLNQVILTTRNINQLLVREKDPDKLLQNVCDTMGKGGGFEKAWIVRFDEKGAFMGVYESGLGMVSASLEKHLMEGNVPWCLRDALEQGSVVLIEDLMDNCLKCPLIYECGGRITLTCSLRYEGETFGVLSATLPKKVILGPEDTNIFNEICEDVAFGLYTIELGQREERALIQIQQNMMQLAAVNDEIRNPLTIIRMLNEFEWTESNRKIIDDQICLIDDLIRKLDIGWVDSEKIWSYLMKHHGIKKQDNHKE